MISYDELKKIAALGKLSLDGVDLDALVRDVGGIIEFADAVAGADLTGLDLTERDELYPLREDVVVPSLANAVILSNAGASRDGFFVAKDRSDGSRGDGK
ncbi:MAG: aspartyl/glutamyl-tRNA amidotransferase subunit C [Oscillospiraceae bacterium]|jgi:aspartyl/glutamyl-tRNA(Asn/Gln) amidotransferase C subunit|nr:aspartyl/glutamyl-tRNA amidotransferase subunit C [Oscillospiraceae bacterium]